MIYGGEAEVTRATDLSRGGLHRPFEAASRQAEGYSLKQSDLHVHTQVADLFLFSIPFSPFPLTLISILASDG